MFLLTSNAYSALRTQVRSTVSSITGGVLGGAKQGSITRALPVPVRLLNSSDEWQLDPQEFTSAMARLVQEGYSFQGIYLIDSESQSAPTSAMIRRWRYNVPCFFVSSTPSRALKISAFALDPLLQKASSIPVWIDQPPDEMVEAHESVPGAILGCDIQTGQNVVLPYDARRLHLYCIGATGTGKTTLLLNIIERDINQGDSVCVLEPHGDFIDDILLRIPSHREQDVILWEVHDTRAPFGLNFFACEDVTNPNLVDRVCSQNISMFYRLYHTSWGPQMENLLRMTFLTMIYNQDLPSAYRPTLIDVPRLWTDSPYRAYLVGRISHDPLCKFWERIYNPLRPGAQLEYRLSSSNKIERFLANRTLYNIFGQTKNSVNYRRVMDEGRILLIKLSKAELGDDNAGLLGSVIVGQISEAAASRVDTPSAQRKQCHLVVDEFQNYATKTFAILQTEARKFAIDTIVSHQTRAMIDDESKGASGAVGNIISFAVTGEDAKEMAMMFDNSPPEPPVTGMKPILTVCTDPWDHLVRNGHSTPRVNTLVMALKAALTTIPKIGLPNYSLSTSNPDMLRRGDLFEKLVLKRSAPLSTQDVRKFITEEDLKRFAALLNSYLYKRMKGAPKHELTNDLQVLGELGPFHTAFAYFERSSHVQVPVGASHLEYVVFDADKSRQLENEQSDRQREFYANLEQLAQLLSQEPILTNSGQYQEVHDKPRPFADVANETANRLGTLKPHYALCRIIDAQGNRVQHLIKTYPPSPVSADGLVRAERIRQASRHQYGRPRDEVEEEIRARGIAWEHLLKRSSDRVEIPKQAIVEKNGSQKHPKPESARMKEDHVSTPTTPNNTVPVPPGGNGFHPNRDDDFWERRTDQH